MLYRTSSVAPLSKSYNNLRSWFAHIEDIDHLRVLTATLGVLFIPEDDLQLQEEKHKTKKSVSESKRGSSNDEKQDAENLKSGMKQKNAINGNQDENRQEIIRPKERILDCKRSSIAKKNKEKYGRLEKNKHSQMNKEKHGPLEKGQHNGNRKEKLGGLIFMCSGKTKPDCFRYRVMGVATSKKDLVLSVKPGLKLFLYDFDLKVMYGIHKASSSGGMKLEPRAFNGAFPVQVRFDVHQDCYPLPESVFKRAIKENYDGKYTLKRNLLFNRPAEVQSHAPPIYPPPVVAIQDREVNEGARESWANLHQESTYGEGRRYLSNENNQHITYQEFPSTQRNDFSQDYYPSEKEYRTYGLRMERQNLSPPRSHVTATMEPYSTGQDDYPSEKENQSYGPPGSHFTPTMEPYSRGPDYYPSEKTIELTVFAGKNMTSVHLEVILLPPWNLEDAVSTPGQATYDSHLVTEKQYQTYSLVPRREPESSTPLVTTTMASTLDSYLTDQSYPYHHGGSSLNPYQPRSRREGVPLASYAISGRGGTYPFETDPLQTREVYLTQTDQKWKGESYLTERNQLGRIDNNDVGRLYSTYTSSAPSYYDQIRKHPVAKTETSYAPVLSRYSLSGPSLFNH
ncbi:DCD (Development and Cell Death) domain protein [Actinidia rufa]|uniref:DCD (Development and Cell Death) domain protein n=1 Tax=Actinidia rufa TaxID=165716 RepID=A0A7J0F865_9ERIC|nr:DCD (Development and Cell Death) domain protein [Actinidia rufa]